jgi:hypothetical protein
MTGKVDFSEEEWKQVLEGPTSAGLLVAAAQRGGTFRESMSIAKAYTEARKSAGASQLLDEIVSSRPEVDTKLESREASRERWLQDVREGAALVEQKASSDEVEGYKQFIVGLAQRVAEAAKDISDEERLAVEEIAEALGTSAPGPGEV